MHDLIIRNARIVDGSGAPTFAGEVAVNGTRITAVASQIDGPARRELDAEGHLLTPGFVDIHTHYDGQVCWDPLLTPSCWHGVTTVVMGNCGMGFAPVHRGREQALIEVMESVEDIPGPVLSAGMPFGWETFAEYLDAIDKPYVMDIGTQVPHVALRHYVMGERSYENDATREEISAMARLTREALKAGALGFSTSRFYGHLDKHNEFVPGTFASAEELLEIGAVTGELGHGSIEIITDRLHEAAEQSWIEELARRSGRPLLILVTSNMGGEIWELAERCAAAGLEVRPQIGARPASVLMTLESTVNPMRQFPSYKTIRDLPVASQRERLRDPVFRAQVLADTPKVPRFEDTARMISTWDRMYVLPADLSYEPGYADSLAGIAAARGLHVREALMDVMAEGRPILYLIGNYPESLEPQRTGIEHARSVVGLSDGGAHCATLCDAGLSTYVLAYYARDRQKGPRLPLEYCVHKMTRDTALAYGLTDRGLLAPGYRADLNIIDFDTLALGAPEMVNDLPAGGRRIIQKASGYRATVCAGEVTFEHGAHTGAMPGRLLRGSAA
ncbi:MAG: N-acyl-D-amino-acid deacylase family protein [Gammaproteobacteria bacterium]